MLPDLPRRRSSSTSFATMLRIRRFEEALIRLAGDARHRPLPRLRRPGGDGRPGARAPRDGDVAYTTHRNHGHLIARGVDPRRACWPRSWASATGTNRGKGGTLHLASAAHGFPTTSSSRGRAAAHRGRLGVRLQGARAGPRERLPVRRRGARGGRVARVGQHRRDARGCRSSSCARTTASRRSARRRTSTRPRRSRPGA